MTTQIIENQYIDDIHIHNNDINIFIKEGISILELNLDNFYLKYDLTYHYNYKIKDSDINIMISKEN